MNMKIDSNMNLITPVGNRVIRNVPKPVINQASVQLSTDSVSKSEKNDPGLIPNVKGALKSAPIQDKIETVPVTDLFITLSGSPGAGKSTQGKLLSKRYGIPHISVGKLLRKEIADNTTLGLMVEPYVKTGDLCPSHIVGAVVKNRLGKDDCKNGFILDGYPRRPEDSKMFEGITRELGIKNFKMMVIQTKPEVVIERFKYRRVCDNGHSYDLRNNPPKKDGVCDHDGLPLHKREDDKPEVIRHRFYVYETETRPVIDYYKEQGQCTVIDGSGNIDQVNGRLTEILDPKEEVEKG